MIRIWVGEVAGVVRAKVERPNRVVRLGHGITKEVSETAYIRFLCLLLARDRV